MTTKTISIRPNANAPFHRVYTYEENKKRISKELKIIVENSKILLGAKKEITTRAAKKNDKLLGRALELINESEKVGMLDSYPENRKFAKELVKKMIRLNQEIKIAIGYIIVEKLKVSIHSLLSKRKKIEESLIGLRKSDKMMESYLALSDLNNLIKEAVSLRELFYSLKEMHTKRKYFLIVNKSIQKILDSNA